MKTIIIFIISFSIHYFSINVYSQTTIVIENQTEIQDALVASANPLGNYGQNRNIHVYSYNGNVNRVFMQFDLSRIPQNAVITKATLILNYNPNSEYAQFHTGHTSFDIHLPASNWNENNINWNNKPSYDPSPIYTYPNSSYQTQSHSINITSTMQKFHENIIPNNGILIKFSEEDNPNNYNEPSLLMLASSEHENINVRPKLIITYNTCAFYQPNALLGLDAVVAKANPDFNYGIMSYIHIYSYGDLNRENETYINFLLNYLPRPEKIKSVKLNLFYDNTNPYNFTHKGENAFWIERTIQEWNENTITWNNRSLSTIDDRVFVPKVGSSVTDYEIDITNLFLNFINSTDQENLMKILFGIKLKLDILSSFESVVALASSDHLNPNLHPKLVICLHDDNQNKFEENKPNELNNYYSNDLNLKNVSDTKIILNFNDFENLENLNLEIVNILGMKIKINNYQIDENKKEISINLSDNIPNGIYIISITNDMHKKSIKFQKS